MMGILMWSHMEGTSGWCFTCGWTSLGLQVTEVSMYDMTYLGPGMPDFTSQQVAMSLIILQHQMNRKRCL